MRKQYIDEMEREEARKNRNYEALEIIQRFKSSSNKATKDDCRLALVIAGFSGSEIDFFLACNW